MDISATTNGITPIFSSDQFVSLTEKKTPFYPLQRVGCFKTVKGLRALRNNNVRYFLMKPIHPVHYHFSFSF